MQQAGMTGAFLNSKRLYLRSLVESDADGPYVNWFNDDEVCAGNSHHVRPFTTEAALSYIRHARQTNDSLILAIVLRDGDKHIGNIALDSINRVYRTAEFSIVIGDKSAWGNGYSNEASGLVCDHGFTAMNLNRIGCGTFEDNEPMKKLAQYLGMKEEGRRRQAVFKRGRYIDIIEFGVLKSEYEARANQPS
jgi:[ribosomal protein S5]-alanine N-acetyltransferase